MGRNSNFKG